MKQIIAIVKPFLIEKILDALRRAPLTLVHVLPSAAVQSWIKVPLPSAFYEDEKKESTRILADARTVVDAVSSLGSIAVQIWQDESAFYAVLDRYFGVHYQSTGYVTGPSELRVLAVPQLDVNVVHEFCHAVS